MKRNLDTHFGLSGAVQKAIHRRFDLVTGKRIIAVGLLTADDVDLLGPTFDRLWPIDETPCFSELLQKIDEADRQLGRELDQSAKS